MSGGWELYRSWLFDEPGLGFRLDVSRMDLPAGFVERMAAPMAAAFEAMEALEGGAIANPDEQRMVGHYWLRAPELAPTEDIAHAIRETRDRVKTFAGRVRRAELCPVKAERFEHLLVIGIGGSALGPQFVADSWRGPRVELEPHFLDNTDPDGIDRVLGTWPIESTLTVVISKSGGTPETRNGMLEAAAVYEASGLDLGPHAVAVTGEASRLDRYATEHAFLERFPMWDWIGGRTSELSAVGLLPAALQGIDVDALLDGAARMDVLTRDRDVMRNPAALLALAWYHSGDGKGAKDMVILPYKDRLALLSRYLQQLVMESLGKETDLDGATVHQGIAVYGNKGSTDQHAYVQQLREGVPNFFATFIQVLRDRDEPGIEVEEGATSGDFLNGFLLGTRRALHDNGRPSLTITVPDVTPRSIGMLIALFERAVGLYASLINVNAYHQPGVEAGKKAAAAVLGLQRELVRTLHRRGEPGGTCAELASAAGTDDVETVFMVLEHLASNPGSGVTRTAGPTPFDAVYRASQ
ncbi:MAG: glucose-6-phosphate isomerase [Planctomycetota bacterium]|jgi:glucose-6-phosphate isomerase